MLDSLARRPYTLRPDRGRWERACVEKCGQSVTYWRHDCGAKWSVPQSCNRRTCGRCSKSRASRTQARYGHAVAAMKWPALVTLTVPNARTPELLEVQLGVLVQGFRELRRRGVWKDCPGLWSIEVTWNPRTGYHPHIHAIVDLPFVSLRELSAEWERLTGARAQPDVKRAITPEQKLGLCREGIKYVSKPWELPEDVLEVLAGVVAGRRLVQPFGGLEPQPESEAGPELCCPRCAMVYGKRRGFKSSDVSQGELRRVIIFGHAWRDYYPDGWGRSPAGKAVDVGKPERARAGPTVAGRRRVPVQLPLPGCGLQLVGAGR